MAVAAENRLTREQEAAVGMRSAGVALSAGAGCGKTFVLTERFLSHLEYDPGSDGAAQLGRLIAITFTERAAREMRDRIRRKVRDRLVAARDPAEEEHWLSVLRRLETAQISTIHSFCGTLLRTNAVEAGLDPRFGVLDPTESETLISELIDDELRRRLAEADPALIDLTADYDLRPVREMVGQFVSLRYRVRFADWTAMTLERLAERWRVFHAEHVLPSLVRKVVEAPVLRRLRRLLAERPPPHPTLAERAAIAAELLDAATAGAIGVRELEALRGAATVQGVQKRNKAWSGKEELYDEYRDGFASLRELIDEVLPHFTFDAAAARPAAEAALRLVALTEPVVRAYDERKRELSVLDFDDLLMKARDLLVAPEHRSLRERLAMRIELLLVDECQDTDPLQAELIDALCGGELGRGKLFFVGDFKQSIYRFRRADPQVFLDMRRRVPEAGRLPLTLNFRSGPAILNFVNALFCEALASEHSPYEPLRPSRKHSPPIPAVEFMWATLDGEPAAEGEDESAAEASAPKLREVEARWIARRIRELVDSEKPLIPTAKDGDDPKLRAVKYGDVAILFRALSDAAIYESALERHGVPYYVVGGKAFYAQQEIFDLLNFLRVLDSACDDVALAGVLRSPFFSLRDETLLQLAEHRDGLAGGLFSPTTRDGLDARERCRVEFAARTIAELRDVKNRLSITALLNELLARTAYDAVLPAEFLGARKLANLRKLLDMARDFDRSGIFTLADYIEQLTEFVVNQPDEPLAATYAEGANVVRLMTIHQSKGLEFPVVFVPDLERPKRPNSASAGFDPRLGPVVKMPDGGPAAKTGLDLFKRIEQEQEDAESLRLFYVATTRAADMLVLSSGVKAGAEPKSPWRRFLASRFDPTTGEFCGTLPAGYGTPQVRVVDKPPPRPHGTVERPTRPDWSKLIDAARRAAQAGGVELPADVEPVPARPDSRRRFSFSRLTGALQRSGEGEIDALTAAVESASAPTASSQRGEAAAFGSLVHAVLAAVDYRSPGDVGRLVRRFARSFHAVDEAAIDDAAALVMQFLASDRARQIARAGEVHRELEFLMSWPPNRDGGDGVYLQGFLDLLYQDETGRWRLVDFKSHRIAAENAAVAAAPYETQLLIYALAAERVLGRAPDELTIHFLRTGREHTITWTDAARRRVVGEVDEAMARLRSTSA